MVQSRGVANIIVQSSGVANILVLVLSHGVVNIIVQPHEVANIIVPIVQSRGVVNILVSPLLPEGSSSEQPHSSKASGSSARWPCRRVQTESRLLDVEILAIHIFGSIIPRLQLDPQFL